MAKRYEKYKDSGIDWIGHIPEHWEICRFKNFISLINSPSTDTNKIGLENIESGTGKFLATDSEFDGNGVEFINGDLIYGKLRPYLKKVWLSNCKGNAVGDFFVFRSNDKAVNQYVKYVLLSEAFTSIADGATYGAKMPRVSSGFILNLHYYVPSIAEQEQIAKYLDWKCVEIDRIVGVRKRQIKLLGELRTSVISRAVTRGLDPYAPLKNSGIDWIGHIPEHWDYKRIKFCLYTSFAGVWGDDASGDENDVRCYRVADFNYEKLSLNDKNPTDRNIDRNTFLQREVKYNDILIEKSGGGDVTPVGRAVLVNLRIKAMCSNFVHCVKVHSNTHNKFLLYILHSMYSKRINLLHFNQTTGIQNLKVAEYLGNAIYSPNFIEQQQVADYLDKKTAEIDNTIEKFKAQIDKLKEYRQALITEVVTGKVDVRGIEIPAPKNN